MVRTLTRNALLTALGLCLALVEQLVPLPVPLPGVRLGLANVITLYLLLTDTPGSAAAVLAARVALAALLFGSATTFFYSAAGGLLAFAAMFLLRRAYPARMSAAGLSMAGAAPHNIGQTAMAALLLWDTAVFAYLPVLLLCALVTGAVTGGAAALLLRRFTGGRDGAPQQ